MYIKRNSAGEISAVSLTAEEGFVEDISPDHPDIKNFLSQFDDGSLKALEKTDAGMARVLEDVVNLLVEQGTIRFTDLPEAAQIKMLSRRELRGQQKGIDLLDDNENLGI